MSETSILDEIVVFLESYVGVQAADPDTDLFASGLVDSMRLVELVSFLEQRFEIRLPQHRLTHDQLSTPARLAALVASRRLARSA